MKFLLLIIGCLFVTSSELISQNDIDQKREELTKIKSEISRLEKNLASQREKEKTSYEALETLNKQNLLLNKLINSLRFEEREKSKAIAKIEEEIKEVKREIESLKGDYAKIIIYMFKKRKYVEWEFLFSSKSINQAMVRYKYLKSISDKKKATISQLDEKNALLELKVEKLEIERKEKKGLVQEKEAEERKLKGNINTRNAALKNLRKDKNAIEKELLSKRNSEKEIRSLINKLIEKEKNRANESTIKKGGDSKSFDYAGFESFNSLKGKLMWPIKGGKIVRKYGENKHELLKTVTINYGIDILIKSDSKAYAVADGIVSAIEWIPGYGSVVIMTHKGGYRTVYGHLSEIYLSEGEKALKGAIVGLVEDSFDGKVLHFEVWKERSNVDPELWLARK